MVRLLWFDCMEVVVNGRNSGWNCSIAIALPYQSLLWTWTCQDVMNLSLFVSGGVITLFVHRRIFDKQCAPIFEHARLSYETIGVCVSVLRLSEGDTDPLAVTERAGHAAEIAKNMKLGTYSGVGFAGCF